jgi:hypothetical protein
MVAAEAWRQNEADTKAARSLRESFMGMCLVFISFVEVRLLNGVFWRTLVALGCFGGFTDVLRNLRGEVLENPPETEDFLEEVGVRRWGLSNNIHGDAVVARRAYFAKSCAVLAHWSFRYEEIAGRSSRKLEGLFS